MAGTYGPLVVRRLVGFGHCVQFRLVGEPGDREFVCLDRLDCAWSRAGVWVLLAVGWTVSVVLSFRQLRGNQAVLAEGDVEDLFRRAQREYLHGNWVQAEQLLSQLTNLNAGDAGARLMLVSLLRRTGQLAEAAAQLRRLEASDAAAPWQGDIARERKFLEEQLNSHQQQIAAENQTSQLDATTVVDKPATNQAA